MNFNIGKKGAVLIAVLLLGTAFFVPVGSQTEQTEILIDNNLGSSEFDDQVQGYYLDRSYILEPLPTIIASDNDDAGWKADAGNRLASAKAIYPGEEIDDSPGRGVNGKLTASSDLQDWYSFSVCSGQQITVSLTVPSGFDFDLNITNKDDIEVAESNNVGSGVSEYVSYVATYPGKWYMSVEYKSGTGTGRYTFSVVLVGQNDSGTSQDASDDFANANLLTPGHYFGYLDMNDGYDWYKFNVNSGQGIHLLLKCTLASLTDFDFELYNPSGDMIYRGSYYFQDEITYPADVSGEWRAKIFLFPGWVDIPNPTEWKYYAYGSGTYDLTFSLESSAPSPPGPITQPQITPMAKTFKIANDPASSKDEYGYFASIPACNYLEGGIRYLAPIIYTGDSTPTAYYDDPDDFGTVDDTTQYLIDDWNTYLDLFGKNADEYNVLTDPIQAAAQIATNNWVSSSTAVVAIDGSTYEDTTRNVLKRTKTLKRTTDIIEFKTNDPQYTDAYGYQMNLGPKWGAINVSTYNVAATVTADILNLWPKFIGMADDWWPDVPGEDRIDTYIPVTRSGIWAGKGARNNSNPPTDIKITKYACDRFRIFLGNDDQTLKVTVKTTEQSDLLVFLVDPSGNLRAPIIGAWNGGPVNPVHLWNGFENETIGFDEWRSWDPKPHTEFSAEVLHPEKGMWTAIVVPRNAEGSSSIKYTITGTVKKLNSKGTNAAISAANAAVIASQKHLPLLYVTEDNVPAETSSAFTALGVTSVIFVERNNIGSGVRSKLPTIETDLTDMADIVGYIKEDPSSENYITITSLKTGVGQATAGAMLAAYHGSPVLRIEEAPDNPAGIANTIEAYLRWDGDYYHGERSNGHIPRADAPVAHGFNVTLDMIKYFISGGQKGALPPFGMDMDLYWFEALYNGVHDMLTSYDLDKDGQEGICFVASRDDICIPVYAALMGNNSYTGGIPGITPAYSSDLVVRNLLYPALIFANPGKDITTTQLMNFPDGGSWTTNDGVSTPVYSSRAVKEAFSSHGRLYDGHCLWDAHLERMNDGASVLYYSGHGTGGSGASAQYIQTEHSKYPEQEWWDGWRGYMYDNWKTPRDGGFTWYNPDPPNLYDILHYKWIDQLYDNLHSNAVFYMSCTTGDADGPMVYLDHGAVCWYGNAGTGLCPEADLQDDNFFNYAMIQGQAIGPAYSTQVWLHFRDYTTMDPTSLYGSSSLYGGAEGGGVTTRQVIYGDPNLIIYSPEWTAPVPVD